MRNTTLLMLAFLLLACVTADAQVPPGRAPTELRRSRQLIVVTTRDWDAVGGTLRRFERRGAQGRWTRVGADVPVVVGRTGLAWGAGLTGTEGAAGPRKREGDGKAP